MTVPVVLTVAGSDSGGCAGIQADLRTFSALRVHGTTAITAITAQNTCEVREVLPLPSTIIARQIEAVAEDLKPAAVKTGMVATPEVVFTIARKFRELQLPNIVVDPVMLSTSGSSLIHDDAIRVLVSNLIPLAETVTPNLAEAEILTGFRIRSIPEMKKAAARILEFGAATVVIKGGHSSDEKESIDVYFDGRDFRLLRSHRVETIHTHGGGCSFAAAIAAHLAKGAGIGVAVSRAKEFISRAIAHSYPVGQGPGPIGHFSHWRLEEDS